MWVHWMSFFGGWGFNPSWNCFCLGVLISLRLAFRARRIRDSWIRHSQRRMKRSRVSWRIWIPSSRRRAMCISEETRWIRLAGISDLRLLSLWRRITLQVIWIWKTTTAPRRNKSGNLSMRLSLQFTGRTRMLYDCNRLYFNNLRLVLLVILSCTLTKTTLSNGGARQRIWRWLRISRIKSFFRTTTPPTWTSVKNNGYLYYCL